MLCLELEIPVVEFFQSPMHCKFVRSIGSKLGIMNFEHTDNVLKFLLSPLNGKKKLLLLGKSNQGWVIFWEMI